MSVWGEFRKGLSRADGPLAKRAVRQTGGKNLRSCQNDKASTALSKAIVRKTDRLPADRESKRGEHLNKTVERVLKFGV